MDSWASVLDEMERRIERCRSDMEAGRFAFDPVRPPAGLGPIPAGLRSRAAAVHSATVALEDEVEVRMAEMSGRLGLRPVFVESRPGPSYVDRRA